MTDEVKTPKGVKNAVLEVNAMLDEVNKRIVSIDEASKLCEISSATFRKLINFDTDNVVEFERGIMSVPDITTAGTSLTPVKHDLFKGTFFLRSEIESLALIIKEKRPAKVTHEALHVHRSDIRALYTSMGIALPEDVENTVSGLLTYGVAQGYASDDIVTAVREMKAERVALQEQLQAQLATKAAMLVRKS